MSKKPIRVTLAIPNGPDTPRRFDGYLPIVFLSRKAAVAWLGWHNRKAAWTLRDVTTWDGLDTDKLAETLAERLREKSVDSEAVLR